MGECVLKGCGIPPNLIFSDKIKMIDSETDWNVSGRN